MAEDIMFWFQLMFYTLWFAVPFGIVGLMKILNFVSEVVKTKKGFWKLRIIHANGSEMHKMAKPDGKIFMVKDKQNVDHRFELEDQCKTMQGIIPVLTYYGNNTKPFNYSKGQFGSIIDPRELDMNSSLSFEAGIALGMKKEGKEEKMIMMVLLASGVAALCSLWLMVTSFTQGMPKPV